MVMNNGEYFNIFKTNIGVKQGGPLSPRLFAMYVEDLITEVESSKSGIKIQDIKVDIIMYADDILLISDTKESLQMLLNVTQRYGHKWEIKFNHDKTVYMELGKLNLKKKKRKYQNLMKKS